MLLTSGSVRTKAMAVCANGRCALAGLLAWSAGAASAWAQSFCQYQVSHVIEGPNCGILGPAEVFLEDINELGQACGSFKSCATSQDQPFAWSEETGFVILPLPPGVTQGEAVSINNVLGSDGLGQIACTLIDTGGHRAWLYDDGKWTLLPPEPGGLASTAEAVNDLRQVIGSRSNTESFFWQDGVFMDLLAEPEDERAHDLNEFSQVCGYVGDLEASVGFLWDSGVVDELPKLANAANAIARALNNGERVVGYSLLKGKKAEPPTHLAWSYDFKELTPIPPPAEYISTLAVDVNDAGQVLVEGRTPPVFLDMYLYQSETLVKITDLVELHPDILFGGDVTSINNRGQLGADGIVLDTDDPHACGLILTPVDQPLGDVNFDCVVDAYDLAMVLGQWGPCPEVGSCLCDIVSRETFQPPGDGTVDAADLAVILGNWTVPSSASMPAKGH